MSDAKQALPWGRLKEEAQSLGSALTEHGLGRASGGVEALTQRLSDYADGSTAGKTAKNVAGGDSPAKGGLKAAASKVKDTVTDKVKGAFGGGGDSGKKIKVTHIYEHVDVPVPREVAYAQWTQFEDFPSFMKKVGNVSQKEPEKVTWQAQVLWSHRTWEAEIVDQVPNERIVWKSSGEKGSVDGAVTFHELAPELTRVLVVLEYHPKGLFEHTGNLWRAQGGRARLELKHFARHVSTQTLIHQDELEGWSGEIHDGELQEQDEKKSGGGSSNGSRSGSRSRSSDKADPESRRGSSGSGRSGSGTAKESRADKPAAKRSAAKKAPAKKAPAKKTAARKSAAKKSSSSGTGSRSTRKVDA
jgi:uncharacterized membrane protein